ncbi:MAG: YkgJ family cysteine cluster protein [Desulfovibrionales bacterium]
MTTNTTPEQTHCRRCGTCCRKGGPALHRCDLPLVMENRIPRTALVTYRSGEPVYDNVAGKSDRLCTDLVKIRGKRDHRECVFFDEKSNLCSLYLDRPVECRVLQCWSPEAITRMYDKQRLQRKDIVAPKSAMGELIMIHEQECSWSRADELVRNILVHQDQEAMDRLGAMVDYDRFLRKRLSNDSGIEPMMLEFYFGRPMEFVLPGLGLRVVPGKRKIVFRPEQALTAMR